MGLVKISWKFQINPYSRLGGVVVTKFGDLLTESITKGQGVIVY